MDKNKQLYRVNQDKVFAGVCTGLSEYLSIDLFVVRLLFILVGLALSPVVIVIYIILAVTMPLNDDLIKKSETVERYDEDDYKIDPNDY